MQDLILPSFRKYLQRNSCRSLNEKIPSKAVQRLTLFTEEYINLFTELAVKYNVNIIGGSHFVEEKEKIYNISYLF